VHSFLMSCWLLCQKSEMTPCEMMVKMLNSLKPDGIPPGSWWRIAWHGTMLPFQICYCATSLCTVLGSIALCVHCSALCSTKALLTALDTFDLHLKALMSTMSSGNLRCTLDSTSLLCRCCKHSTRQQPTKPGINSRAST